MFTQNHTDRSSPSPGPAPSLFPLHLSPCFIQTPDERNAIDNAKITGTVRFIHFTCVMQIFLLFKTSRVSFHEKLFLREGLYRRGASAGTDLTPRKTRTRFYQTRINPPSLLSSLPPTFLSPLSLSHTHAHAHLLDQNGISQSLCDADRTYTAKMSLLTSVPFYVKKHLVMRWDNFTCLQCKETLLTGVKHILNN